MKLPYLNGRVSSLIGLFALFAPLDVLELVYLCPLLLSQNFHSLQPI